MSIRVHSLWLAQDDPKKNTAVISSKRGDIKLHKKISTLPKKGIILEPLCGKIFGPEDHDILTEKNLVCKRPGDGINPMKWNQVIGKKAIKDFDIDEFIIFS